MGNIADPDEPMVCIIDERGELVCSPSSDTVEVISDASTRQQLEKSIAGAFRDGEWGENKLKLALNFLSMLAKARIADADIPRRSGDVVDAGRYLLSKEPPSIMLFNYSSQPANVVGAYYLNKADLVQMQRLFDQFKDPAPH